LMFELIMKSSSLSAKLNIKKVPVPNICLGPLPGM
jgi:hypothetical protein